MGGNPRSAILPTLDSSRSDSGSLLPTLKGILASLHETSTFATRTSSSSTTTTASPDSAGDVPEMSSTSSEADTASTYSADHVACENANVANVPVTANTKSVGGRKTRWDCC